MFECNVELTDNSASNVKCLQYMNFEQWHSIDYIEYQCPLCYWHRQYFSLCVCMWIHHKASSWFHIFIMTGRVIVNCMFFLWMKYQFDISLWNSFCNCIKLLIRWLIKWTKWKNCVLYYFIAFDCSPASVRGWLCDGLLTQFSATLAWQSSAICWKRNK